ncbi:MAG TPA: GrrA/OscA1 family cyclophane-containing rSAM-modified RiPP [Gemmataceae bacterium]|nr:GrrA/OscA1 family cyclophane-containing rSAM-modified RiPP [Gemmataceae bacterium]
MASTDRRRFLKELLGTLAGAAGSVVLASASTSPASATEPPPGPQPGLPGDIQDRAEKIADAAGTTEEEVALGEFVNGGFRNGVGGGFRNGGFGNGVGGGFRNGAFRNGAGGGFRNGAFRNW